MRFGFKYFRMLNRADTREHLKRFEYSAKPLLKLPLANYVAKWKNNFLLRSLRQLIVELYFYNLCTARPWLRRLVANPRLIQVGFVVEMDTVAQGQVSLQVFHISRQQHFTTAPYSLIHSFIHSSVSWLVLFFVHLLRTAPSEPGPPHCQGITNTDTPHSVGLLWASD